MTLLFEGGGEVGGRLRWESRLDGFGSQEHRRDFETERVVDLLLEESGIRMTGMHNEGVREKAETKVALKKVNPQSIHQSETLTWRRALSETQELLPAGKRRSGHSYPEWRTK